MFHRFGNGFFIDFSSYLHKDIAPLPNLPNPVFEQRYGVPRSKSSFWPFRKTCCFLSFAPSLFLCCNDFNKLWHWCWLHFGKLLAPKIHRNRFIKFFGIPKSSAEASPFRHFFGPCPQELLFMILVSFWLPFWHPFGSFLAPFGSILPPFGSRSVALAPFSHPLGSIFRFFKNHVFP